MVKQPLTRLTRVNFNPHAQNNLSRRICFGLFSLDTCGVLFTSGTSFRHPTGCSFWAPSRAPWSGASSATSRLHLAGAGEPVFRIGGTAEGKERWKSSAADIGCEQWCSGTACSKRCSNSASHGLARVRSYELQKQPEPFLEELQRLCGGNSLNR